MSKPICEKHGCEKVWVNNKTKKAGGMWRCPECNKESNRRWRKANPEYERERYRANPELFRAKHDRWVKANPERNAENFRRWREENLEAHLQSVRQWYQDNPEKEASKGRRRRARKAGALVADHPVTAAIEAERKALFGGCCFCGADKALTLEHVVPISKGGLHVADNLLGSCSWCNTSKKDRPVEEWYRAQPFFSEQRWQEITCACSLPSSSCAA